ncbi:RabGAP/TBC [Polychaeton citri CBS 116435]|uniref:GTPase-activating protein GYP7 n=1 Tax=Polychaeton citri CBS 116435 TaxID=1314669 RepID=A0A9P4QCB3_9PEZI|nr:RabGAP/TBC [Polychaeton citri CBS 116435]
MPPKLKTSVDHAPDSPPSPTASYYDMSDDSESEYSTIKHAKVDSGVKLLHAKSKVYVHPSASAKDNVAGHIALIQQKASSPRRESIPSSSTANRATNSSNLLLAWSPENGLSSETKEKYSKVEGSASDSPPKQTYLVPPPPVTTQHSANLGSFAFAVPISEIFSILSRPPSSGWWHGSLVVNTRAGESFPALFFHDSECESTQQHRKRLQRENFDISGQGGGMFWGGDQILTWLKQYVTVERSTHEPNIYLIDPTDSDKLSFGSGGKPTQENVRNVLEGKNKDEQTPQQKQRDQKEDPLGKALTQARWTLLEKFSQVTSFTRRTAESVANNKNIPPQVRRLMQNPQVQTVSDEFDSARLYLARWAMGIAEQSERERNRRIWTAKDMLKKEEGELGDFEILEMDAQGLSLADKRKPVTLKEWDSWFNARTGKLERTIDEAKERIFHGGLDGQDGVRKEAWLFLLGVYEWDSTKDERRAKLNSLRDEYIRLKGAWWERMVDEQGTLEEREWWKEQKMRIEKDVHRTDRHIPIFAGEDIPHPDPDSPFAEAGTNVHLEQMKDMLLTYNEHNRDLGYVQGMSDLLAPIYAIQQDDAVAFWAFAGFMERMERNFLRDQSGMRLQLLTLDHLVQLLDPRLYEHLEKLDSTNFFFFFRMLLVWFKREFEFSDILRLWEGLWSDYLSANFHLFIAMAILEKHREVILEHLKGFDEVLKYVNELSGTIDLPSTLIRAEGLFRKFQKTVEAVDKRNNFMAAPSVRQRNTSAPQENAGTSPDASVPSSPQAQIRAAVIGGPGKSPAAAAARRQDGGASTSGREQTVSDQLAAGMEQEKDKVVSSELRDLLSREIPKLHKSDVQAHGGGVGPSQPGS